MNTKNYRYHKPNQLNQKLWSYGHWVKAVNMQFLVCGEFYTFRGVKWVQAGVKKNFQPRPFR